MLCGMCAGNWAAAPAVHKGCGCFLFSEPGIAGQGMHRGWNRISVVKDWHGTAECKARADTSVRWDEEKLRSSKVQFRVRAVQFCLPSIRNPAPRTHQRV